MADAAPNSASQANRKKWLAVVVLAVALGLILVFQHNAATPSESLPGDAAAQSSEEVNRAVARPAKELGTDSLPKKPWPEIALSEALKHDPFQALTSGAVASNAKDPVEPSPGAESSAAEPSATESGAEADGFEKLEGQTINIIFRNHRGTAAVLGSRVIQAGDVYEGLRVESIGLDGVVFENGQEK